MPAEGPLAAPGGASPPPSVRGERGLTSGRPRHGAAADLWGWGQTEDGPAMNLDFSDDQKALQAQVRRYLAEHCTTAQVRKILEGPEAFDRGLYAGLAEIGVLGSAIPEEYGGA